MLSCAVLSSWLALTSPAAPLNNGGGQQSDTAASNRREELTRLSQRLAAGDTSAIDELLARTRPTSSDHAPSSADIERLRIEVERLRAARPRPPSETSPAPDAPASREESSAVPSDAGSALRAARAWLRAGDPSRALKALPPGDKADEEALYERACALERLGRDDEALDAFRRVAASASTPLLKLCAASGVEHVEWRTRGAHSSQEKP
jgi:hypothetical protein